MSVSRVPPAMQQVASGLRWGFVDVGLQQALRFGLTVVLTRLVVPHDYGLLAMALVFTQIATMVGDLGLGPALVQREEVEPRHVSTATAATLLGGIVLGALTALAAWPVAAFYGEPRLQPLVVVLATTYILRGIGGVPKELLRRAMRFRSFAAVSAASLVSSGVAGVVLAAAGAGAWALVVSVVVENAVGAAAVAVAAWRAGVWRADLRFDRHAWREIGRFGAYVSGVRLAYYGATNVDNLIVGKVLGGTALGLYNLAYRAMLFPVLRVADIIANVTMPVFSRMQGDRERLVEAFLRAQRAIALVCMPVSLVTAAAAPVLVPFVFGIAWVPAVVTVQVLALNGPRLAIGRLNGAVYEATGRPQWDFVVMSVTFAAYVVAFVIGVHWGIEGVAWGFTIAGYCLVPLDQWLLARCLGGSVWAPARSVVPFLVAAGAGAGVAYVVGGLTDGSSSGARSIVEVGAAAITYLLVVRMLRPGALRDVLVVVGRRSTARIDGATTAT